MFGASACEIFIKHGNEEAAVGSPGGFGMDRDCLLQRGTVFFTARCRALAFRVHPGELGKRKTGAGERTKSNTAARSDKIRMEGKKHVSGQKHVSW